MDNDSSTLIITLVVTGIPAFGALITAIVTSINSAKKQTVEALTKTVATLQTENARYCEENEKLRERIEALEQAGDETKNKVETLEHENSDLRSEVQRLTQENDRLKIENNNLTIRLDQLEKNKSC